MDLVSMPAVGEARHVIATNKVLLLQSMPIAHTASWTRPRGLDVFWRSTRIFFGAAMLGFGATTSFGAELSLLGEMPFVVDG